MNEHSFAVLAYKDSPYLEACIDSLMRQTIPTCIFIATSTPSDYISSIARKYGLSVHVAESGKGIAHDWNFALRQASTKHVTIAHQDDLYDPSYAANCLQKLNQYPNALICFTDYAEIVNEAERKNNLLLLVKRVILTIFMPFQKHIDAVFWKKAMLSVGCPIAAPSVTYNLENLEDFHFSATFSINLDWDAWYRLACRSGKFVYINKVLLKHRIHEHSATTAGLQAALRQSEDVLMFGRFWPKFVVAIVARLYAISYKSNKIS